MDNAMLDKLVYYMTDIYSNLIIKLVVAVIILLVGFILAKLIGRLIYKLLSELDINQYFRKATGISISPDSIISKTITYLLDFFVIIIALDAIALTPSIIQILSGAIIIIIVFSILIGIKDLIPNVIAGLYIFRKKMFSVGDEIKINEHRGKIIRIDLVETIIEKSSKDLLYIPNSAIIKSIVLHVKRV